MSTAYATTPEAPGSLGADVAPQLLLDYLGALGTWRDRRKRELDELDEAALHAPDREALTSDVTLSMTLWKAVADRHDLLVATWDSGRVGPSERQRMTTLIWGRLDHRDGSALAVSLPEAMRLSDSLAASLRSRLRLDGAEPELANRTRALRAQVERIRDQVALVPEAQRASAAQTLDQLDRKVTDLADRVRRGADVGGIIGVLEASAATAERDLIVAASTRAQTATTHAKATALRAELAARGDAVRAVASRALAEVSPAPRLGIPDVTALGEVPTDSAALTAYLARLDQVGRALSQAHAAYAGALDQRADLEALHRDHVRAAGSLGAVAAADLGTVAALADDVLAARPVDVRRLAALVAAEQAYLTKYGAGGPAGGGR